MSQNHATTAAGAASSAQLKFSFAKGPVSARTSSHKTSTTVFAAHDNSDSEDEIKVSKIMHIGEGAPVEHKPKDEKAPLVIKPPESMKEHWLERRLKLFRPDAIDNKPPEGIDLAAIPDRIGDESVKAGLQLPQKASAASTLQNTPEPQTPQVTGEVPKTEEELSRELLIREAMNPKSSTFNAPKLIIPSREPLSETDVYAHDMATLSDAPTLETYERVPVEAFGMGILLGLGWKEGTDLHGQSLEKLKEPKKRPDFLGIGAKEEEFLRKDSKGQKLSRKDGLGASWNPLKRVHKETGEVLMEDDQRSRQSSVEGKYRKSNDSSRNGSRRGSPNGGRDQRYREKDGYSKSDRGRYRDRHQDGHRLEEIRRDRREDSSRRSDRGYDSERSSHDMDYDSDRYHERRRREEKSSRSRRSSRSGERDRDYHRSQR